MTEIKQALAIFDEICEDCSIPKNVRESIREISKMLKNKEQSMDLIIDTVMQRIDELNNDSNLPMYTRTQMWSVVSLLES